MIKNCCLGLAIFYAGFTAPAGAADASRACEKISGKLASVSYEECLTLQMQPSGYSSVEGFPLLVKEYPPLELSLIHI